MFKIQAEITIAAEAEKVWSILTNPDALTQNGSGITKIEGQISKGSKFRLWSDVSPDRAFPLRVTAWDPVRRMTWSGGMPLGLFTGRRTFSVTATNESVMVSIEEVFTGPLSGLMQRVMPDLRPSFMQLLAHVKKQAEV